MRRNALEWARELLGSAGPAGPGLDLRIEREALAYSRFQRQQVFRAELSFWEPAGLVALPAGGGARYPADPQPWDQPPPPRPPRGGDPLAPELAARVEQALRGRRREGGAWRWDSWWRGADGAWVWVDRQAPDARLILELDPAHGGRLGASLPFLARGSTRCAALSRPRAVCEARAALALPEEAVLVYTRLCRTGDRRVWSLRWRVGAGPLRGDVRAVLNARSGALVEREVRVWPAPEREQPPASERGAAERAIVRHVRSVLGRGAWIGPLIPGVAGPEARPCWLAVVATPAGTRVRATWAGGRVSLGPARGAG